MDSIIFLGDSYTTAIDLPETDRYAYKLSKAFGMKYYNWARGGTGILPFCDQIHVQKSFEQGWASLSEADKKSVKMIVIAAGRNDATHYHDATLATWLGAVRNLMNSITQRTKAVGTYEELKIYVAPMINRWIPLDDYRVTQYSFFVQALTLCSNKAIVIDRPFTWMIGHNETRLPDNSHFNAAGQDILYRHFLSAIGGNNYTETKSNTFYLKSASGLDQVTGGTLKLINDGWTVNLTAELSCNAPIPANTNLLVQTAIPQRYMFITRNTGVVFSLGGVKMVYSAVYNSDYTGITLSLKPSQAIPAGTYVGNVSFSLGLV